MTTVATDGVLRWERLTWCEVAALRQRLDMAILPIGSTEQHGPHLAMDTDFDDCMVGLRFVGDVSARVRAEYDADGADWHANCAETALMMALAPDRVRPERIAEADDPDRTGELLFSHPVNRTSTNGVTGTPSRATRAAGERLFTMIVDDLTAQVTAGLRERPPLAASYFAAVEEGVQR